MLKRFGQRFDQWCENKLFPAINRFEKPYKAHARLLHLLVVLILTVVPAWILIRIGGIEGLLVVAVYVLGLLVLIVDLGLRDTFYNPFRKLLA